MTGSKTVPLQQRRATFEKGVSTRGLLSSFFAFFAVGCASTSVESDPARMADAENAHVLADVIDSAEAPCSGRMPSASQDAAVSPLQVFVEAFLIEVPSDASWRFEPGSLPALARVPRAKLLATPHLIATLETRQTMDLSRRLLPPGATLEPGVYFEGMTVLPRFGDSGALVLEVDVALQTLESSEAPNVVPAETHVRNTFVAQEKRVSWLAVSVPGYSKSSLLLGVKPYLVRDQIDLRSIFDCKMQQRKRSLARRQSGAH